MTLVCSSRVSFCFWVGSCLSACVNARVLRVVFSLFVFVVFCFSRLWTVKLIVAELAVIVDETKPIL